MPKLRLGEEMYKKYLSTTFRLKETVDDEGILFTFSHWTNDIEGDWPSRDEALQVEGYVYDPKSGRKKTMSVDLTQYILDFDLPPLGYYNDEEAGVAVYVRRVHYRQWKRGFSLSHTVETTANFGGHSLGELKPEVRDVMDAHYSVIAHKTFNKILYSLDEAVTSVLEGRMLTAAFTHEYSVGVNAITPGCVCLYHKNIPIGVVDKTENGDYTAITPKKGEHFVEDVSQYMNTVTK